MGHWVRPCSRRDELGMRNERCAELVLVRASEDSALAPPLAALARRQVARAGCSRRQRPNDPRPQRPRGWVMTFCVAYPAGSDRDRAVRAPAHPRRSCGVLLTDALPPRFNFGLLRPSRFHGGAWTCPLDTASIACKSRPRALLHVRPQRCRRQRLVMSEIDGAPPRRRGTKHAPLGKQLDAMVASGQPHRPQPLRPLPRRSPDRSTSQQAQLRQPPPGPTMAVPRPGVIVCA